MTTEILGNGNFYPADENDLLAAKVMERKSQAVLAAPSDIIAGARETSEAIGVFLNRDQLRQVILHGGTQVFIPTLKPVRFVYDAEKNVVGVIEL